MIFGCPPVAMHQLLFLFASKRYREVMDESKAHRAQARCQVKYQKEGECRYAPAPYECFFSPKSQTDSIEGNSQTQGPTDFG